jgi:hypothetical protein
MRSLERQRQNLIARSNAQRQELVANASAARETIRRLRVFLRMGATVARLRRLWSLLGG